MKASWTFYYADVLIIPNKFATSWNPDKQQGHNNLKNNYPFFIIFI